MGSDQGSEPRARKRGPSKAYSQFFEDCWALYGRKEEKAAAYTAWKIAAREFGGEENLRVLVLGALKWQAPIWAKEGWKFAKYFERYLKKKRWQDEPIGPRGVYQVPARPSGPPVAVAELAAERAAKLAEQARQAQAAEAERFQREKEADQRKEQQG